MVTPNHAAAEATARSRFIHQEILKLALLGVVAVAAFFVTRTIAASNRDMTLRDGAEWFERGQHQLARGEVAGAIDSFRRASVRNRSEKRYALALARALATQRQYDAARRALLALRASAPEDPGINLQLARLAAERQDVPEALRYYHDTLYAPWTAEQADARRRVRLELIQFLMSRGQPSRALSELLALSVDLPEDDAAHVRIGQLFAEAGDSRRALEQFQRALRLAPRNVEALAGAGQAAFQVGDYTSARRYLRTLPDGADNVRETRDLVELVLSHDPLASRLSSAERRRRLGEDFSYAEQRLRTCLDQHAAGATAPADDGLLQDTSSFATELKRPAAGERDTLDEGLELIYRIERDVTQRCPPATLLDRALILIGEKHGAD